MAAVSHNDDRADGTDRRDRRPARRPIGRRRPVDPHAPEAVYERNVDAIYAYLARRLGPDQGEELTSQVFLEAFTNEERFDARRGNERAWLFGIAVNVLRHHHRQEARRRRAVARLQGRGRVVEIEEESALDRVWARDSRDEIATCLAELAPGEREVLLLHAWTDLTYADIAGALDLPIGTVRSRLSRARTRLAASLGPHALRNLRGTA